MPEIEVVFAGWDVSGYEIPFKHRNLGIVTPQVLADSYAICDMCLVISNTNLSLVPFEVMGLQLGRCLLQGCKQQLDGK